jgi:SAM-dependent methyltransferase
VKIVMRPPKKDPAAGAAGGVGGSEGPGVLVVPVEVPVEVFESDASEEEEKMLRAKKLARAEKLAMAMAMVMTFVMPSTGTPGEEVGKVLVRRVLLAALESTIYVSGYSLEDLVPAFPRTVELLARQQAVIDVVIHCVHTNVLSWALDPSFIYACVVDLQARHVIRMAKAFACGLRGDVFALEDEDAVCTDQTDHMNPRVLRDIGAGVAEEALANEFRYMHPLTWATVVRMHQENLVTAIADEVTTVVTNAVQDFLRPDHVDDHGDDSPIDVLSLGCGVSRTVAVDSSAFVKCLRWTFVDVCGSYSVMKSAELLDAGADREPEPEPVPEPVLEPVSEPVTTSTCTCTDPTDPVMGSITDNVALDPAPGNVAYLVSALDDMIGSATTRKVPWHDGPVTPKTYNRVDVLHELPEEWTGKFHAAVIAMTLPTHKAPALLTEAARVIRPGGRLVIAERILPGDSVDLCMPTLLCSTISETLPSSCHSTWREKDKMGRPVQFIIVQL